MSHRIHPQDVMKALANVKDLASGRDVVSLGRVKGVEVGDNRVSFTLELASPSSPTGEQMVQAAGRWRIAWRRHRTARRREPSRPV